jgi:hypothetical protein
MFDPSRRYDLAMTYFEVCIAMVGFLCVGRGVQAFGRSRRLKLAEWSLGPFDIEVFFLRAQRWEFVLFQNFRDASGDPAV